MSTINNLRNGYSQLMTMKVIHLKNLHGIRNLRCVWDNQLGCNKGTEEVAWKYGKEGNAGNFCVTLCKQRKVSRLKENIGPEFHNQSKQLPKSYQRAIHMFLDNQRRDSQALHIIPWSKRQHTSICTGKQHQSQCDKGSNLLKIQKEMKLC